MVGPPNCSTPRAHGTSKRLAKVLRRLLPHDARCKLHIARVGKFTQMLETTRLLKYATESLQLEQDPKKNHMRVND